LGEYCPCIIAELVVYLDITYEQLKDMMYVHDLTATQFFEFWNSQEFNYIEQC